MTMVLGPGEPLAGPWHVVPLGELLHVVLDIDHPPADRPWILAVDGRAGSGKSTLANRLCHLIPNCAVVHTDDIAWHHSFFGWSDLMIEGILRPLQAGKAVHYRPPGWDSHGRSGAIDIAQGLDVVMIEGVGASRTELAPWIDRSVWVQSDYEEAERRGIARDGKTKGAEEARSFWYEWQAEEVNFLQRQRPWERATIIVNGTPRQPYRPGTEVVVAPALHRSDGSFVHASTRSAGWEDSLQDAIAGMREGDARRSDSADRN